MSPQGENRRTPPGEGAGRSRDAAAEVDFTRWCLRNAPGARRAHEEVAFAPRAALGGPMQFLALQRRFGSAPSVEALFGRASESGHAECGFDRSVVLAVDDGTVTASRTPTLKHAPSEGLRQLVADHPVHLTRGTVEAEFVRLAEGGRGDIAAGRSALRAPYGLREFALGAVMLDVRVLALVLVDRTEPGVTLAERTAVQGFTQLVSGALERLVLRQQVASIAAEVSQVTASASAVLQTVVEGEVGLPAEGEPAAPRSAAAALNLAPLSADVHIVFTRRELSIMKLLVRGRTNREMAEQLHISLETVKKYMSRIMRKTGAANRADAALRCVPYVNR